MAHDAQLRRASGQSRLSCAKHSSVWCGLSRRCSPNTRRPGRGNGWSRVLRGPQTLRSRLHPPFHHPGQALGEKRPRLRLLEVDRSKHSAGKSNCSWGDRRGAVAIRLTRTQLRWQCRRVLLVHLEPSPFHPYHPYCQLTLALPTRGSFSGCLTGLLRMCY